jgi:hypothetical protein
MATTATPPVMAIKSQGRGVVGVVVVVGVGVIDQVDIWSW